MPFLSPALRTIPSEPFQARKRPGPSNFKRSQKHTCFSRHRTLELQAVSHSYKRTTLNCKLSFVHEACFAAVGNLPSTLSNVNERPAMSGCNANILIPLTVQTQVVRKHILSWRKPPPPCSKPSVAQTYFGLETPSLPRHPLSIQTRVFRTP